MPMMRVAFPVGLVVACAWPITALAQSEAENRATARALGQQGQAAFNAKDYKKSEDAFRRADGLYHAPTLSLGLARSQAAEGKFVEAWENYNRIILEGVTSSPAFASALTEAKAGIGAIEGRRSRVTIGISGSDAPHVSLDDRPLKSEALGIELFVDPGTHTVVVNADGYSPETRTFAVAEGKSETVSIALQRAAGAALSAPSPTTPMDTAGTTTTLSADAGATGAPNHVPSFVAFGIGGAGLVTGVIAGILAIGKHGDLQNACTTVCGPAEQSNLDSYHTVALVSTVGFVVAGAGAAAGVVLWFVAPRSGGRPSNAAWIAPYMTPGSVGAVGRF